MDIIAGMAMLRNRLSCKLTIVMKRTLNVKLPGNSLILHLKTE
jgi:hypothetical protein